MSKQLKPETLATLGDMLVWTAQTIWEEAGVNMDDFCIQSENLDVIVFGSVNRVIWSPAFGFKIDRAYCTEKFIAGFERWQQKRRGQ